MTIAKALKLVRNKYEWAKAVPYINDPVAWALYQTWKESEEKPKKQNTVSDHHRFTDNELKMYEKFQQNEEAET